MSNLIKRTIFGAIYVALIVCSLLFFRPYAFQLVFILFSVLAVREYHHINHSDTLLTICGMLLSWLLFAATSLLCCTAMWTAATWLFVAYVAVLIICVIMELFKKATNPLGNLGILFSGQVLVALPFALMSVLFGYSNMMLLTMFVIIWTNDTGAYCVGSLIGKHKMFPRVSPGKSWEGFVGGMVFALAVSYVFLADPWHFTGLHLKWYAALLIGAIIVVFGTLGDLIESLTKRTLGIKDSGNVIPGHGGWLDRFDSALLAAPVLALIVFVANTLL